MRTNGLLRKTRLTTRSGAWFDITYDGLDREVLKDPSAAGEPSIASVYDLSGRVMSVSQVGGTTFDYTYDVLKAAADQDPQRAHHRICVGQCGQPDLVHVDGRVADDLCL